MPIFKVRILHWLGLYCCLASTNISDITYIVTPGDV
jgi:hypothetical protein